MFTKTDKNKSETKNTETNAVPSVISDDMNILGNIISDGYIDINGRIEGNIKCRSVTVREKGMVKGDIIADVVHVHGEVNGLIKSKSVNLHSTCRVSGVIMHESISIEDGAFVDGQCKRSDKVMEHQASQGKSDGAPTALLENNIRLISDAAE